MSEPIRMRECQGNWHNSDCRRRTELTRYPHDIIKADEPWITETGATERCSRCYAFGGRRLAEPCGQHPDQPPTLSYSYPTCTGCWREVSSDGDIFVCDECDVYWGMSDGEDTPGEWAEEREFTPSCVTDV